LIVSPVEHLSHDLVVVGTGSHRFADLAERLVALGVRAAEYELVRFAAHARRQGVDPLLVSILADPTQPDVARERAFGRIAVELGTGERATSTRSIPGPSAA
jgi:hypothetical protein